MDDLLKLPQRSDKPRSHGLTHVLDKGLSLAAVDALAEVAGPYVDIVKLGWGTALVTGNLEPKLSRYRAHGMPVVLGGTLTEVAISQGRVEQLMRWIDKLGLTHVEVSDGVIALDHHEKLALIERLARNFTVLSEVGSKDDTKIMAPYRWIELIELELAAGAWKVITEARESGTVGIFRHDGEVRQGLIDEVVHAIPADRLLFEAPQKDQQVWFVKKLGANVNIGNVPPDDVISLETIRLGLRADTAALGDGGAGAE
jgi:phosphosulfolactate synthase